MSILLHPTTAGSVHLPSRRPSFMEATSKVVRAVLGWPLRVHANRKLLGQMAGMSARDLADIGLTPADLRDSTALPIGAEIGHFLSARARSHRHAGRNHRPAKLRSQ